MPTIRRNRMSDNGSFLRNTVSRLFRTTKKNQKNTTFANTENILFRLAPEDSEKTTPIPISSLAPTNKTPLYYKATLRINNECNFNCLYCYDRNKQRKGDMSSKTAEDIIAFAKQNHLLLEIPQTEPTISSQLTRFIESGLVTGITTNGYNLPLSLLKLLKLFNIHLLISYDGIWQDKYRLRGNHPTSSVVEKNILAVKGLGIPFNIACVVPGDEVHRLYENYLYLSNLTQAISFNFDWTSEYAIKDKHLKTLKEQSRKILKTARVLPFPYNKIYNLLKSNRKIRGMCGAGKSICIDYDGTIYPCYHCLSWKRMNFNYGTIYSIEKRHLPRPKYPMEKCKKCKSALCGLCYTSNFETTGNPYRPPEIHCKLFVTLTEVIKECFNLS